MSQKVLRESRTHVADEVERQIARAAALEKHLARLADLMGEQPEGGVYLAITEARTGRAKAHLMTVGAASPDHLTLVGALLGRAATEIEEMIASCNELGRDAEPGIAMLTRVNAARLMLGFSTQRDDLQ